MADDLNIAPGEGFEQEIADAFNVFLETVSTLIGMPIFDYTKVEEAGLIAVCILANAKVGHTSNWSNVPPVSQTIVLQHHLNNTVREFHGIAEVRKPN